jgi:hypothetical protein
MQGCGRRDRGSGLSIGLRFLAKNEAARCGSWAASRSTSGSARAIRRTFAFRSNWAHPPSRAQAGRERRQLDGSTTATDGRIPSRTP